MRQKNAEISESDPDDVHPVGIIVVATHERDGSDLLERSDHGIAADIAGMKDVIDASERGKSLVTDQGVCVGNDTD